MCRIVALTRDNVASMEVKIRRRADGMQGGMYGWRRGIDGGEDTVAHRCFANIGVRMATWY